MDAIVSDGAKAIADAVDAHAADIAYDRQAGIAIRFVKEWDIKTDRLPSHFDVWTVPSEWGL